MIFGQPKANSSFRKLQPVFGQQRGEVKWGPAQFAPPMGQQKPQMDPYYSAAVGPQAQKDMAAFGALQGLGASGLNATGQYGVARDTALANQGIAAANMAGMMGNSYYNTIGQLGNYAAGLSAAGLNAGAQSVNANIGGNFDFGMGGGFNMGGGGGRGGFSARGPEGTISSGRIGGGGGRGGFGANFDNRGSGSYGANIQKGSSVGERAGIINQGYGFLGGLVDNLNDPNNQAMSMANMAQKEFGANRAAIMDPSILNSLNWQVDRGYGAVNDVYDRSDYGFNTGRRSQQPGYKPIEAQPDYWKNPFGSGSQSWNKNAGGFR